MGKILWRADKERKNECVMERRIEGNTATDGTRIDRRPENRENKRNRPDLRRIWSSLVGKSSRPGPGLPPHHSIVSAVGAPVKETFFP